MPKASSQASQASSVSSLDLDNMSVDSSRLTTIAEEATECEMSQSTVTVSLPPSNHKETWTGDKIIHDLEEVSLHSDCSESTVFGTVNGDVCAYLGSSRINFSLSKCNIILSMVALVFLLAIGYKWSSFLIALIIVTALLIHVMVIWWLNDEGFFFPARKAAKTTEEPVVPANASKPEQSNIDRDDIELGRSKPISRSQSMPSRLAQV
ncbi:hypothetical protein MPSEU_000803600 [Mayamaea pseudoterrestris]|nr:hypothetical protein MPSEU_000803600 [Mayamaea pseudoterrestris]